MKILLIKRKIDKSVVSQITIMAFHNLTNLSEARINQINRALVKFFVCCEIAYRIVKHPFLLIFCRNLMLVMNLQHGNTYLDVYLKLNYVILIKK